MKKVLVFLAVMVCFFGLAIWGLTLLPWGKWFSLSNLSKEKQEQISQMLLDSYSNGKPEIKDDSVLHTLNLIRNRICFTNNIDTGAIHLHVFEDEQVNAFTLPLGHVVIQTALIKECDNPEMLAGVMAHEIAHSELNHIGKRMATEIGLSVALGLLFGDSGFIMNIIHLLTSRGFDRSQEQDADDTGMRYLQNARIDTRPMGVFLNKLAEKETDMPKSLEWVNTHPNPGKRAKIILSQPLRNNHQPVIDSIGWNKLGKRVGGSW